MSANLMQNTVTAPGQYPMPAQGSTYVLAQYDLQTYDPSDLEFKVGDLLVIHNKSGDWWQGFNPRTGKQGFVPFNYVTENDGVILAALHNVNREQAIGILLNNASNGDANWLLRPRAGDTTFALSVRFSAPDGLRVKHYMLSFDTSTGQCYLREDSRFHTVQQLIIYYQQHEIEDNCYLRRPVP